MTRSTNRSQCTAKSKRTGKQCGQYAEPGRKVCRHHGGRIPRGLAHPNTKTGLHSLDLSTRLAARAQAGLDDPLLMDLRDAIAWQKAVEEVLREQVGEGGSVGAVMEAKAAWTALRADPSAPGRQERMDRAIEALGGMADSLQKVEEIGKQIDRRARLVKTAVESNLDTLMASQFALEVGYVQRALAAACEKHFDTPKARQAFMMDVQQALERLMHRGEG